jgi:hypothetical protein
MGWVQGMSERIRPFTAREFKPWKWRNCRRCNLRWREGQGYRCDIEAAIDYAHLDNGTVTKVIGKRLRFEQCVPDGHVAEECLERVLEEAAT